MVSKNTPSLPILIVGAGISGLTCALRLHQAGIPVQLIEASDGVGGRVRTDLVDGYLLDRGFQVYLSAYPEAGQLIDTEALELMAFEPGAMVYNGARLHRVMDIFRRPKHLFTSAFAPIGSLMDKLRVALLRFQTLGSSQYDIQAHRDQSTESYLQEFGFSQRMIDTFFRSFYGGIFLENELRTSSRMFEFTFKMFSQGSATLPARGMGQIPLQLAKKLPPETIRINTPVTSLSPTSVSLPDGSVIHGSQVVVATQAPQTSLLVPDFSTHSPSWRAVTNVYFSSDHSPLNEPIIALNGTSKGLVNNVCVPSDVSPHYAPPGKSLISVSLLASHKDPEIPNIVKNELKQWFGNQVMDWQHLRTDIIKHALPEQLPTRNPKAETKSPEPTGFLHLNGVFICGDHTTSASIEGAIISGNKTANAVLASLPE